MNPNAAGRPPGECPHGINPNLSSLRCLRCENDALAAENASLSEALAAANREAAEASKRLAEAERRYEYFRRINPGQFHDLWSACLFNLRFDEEVDRRSTDNAGAQQ